MNLLDILLLPKKFYKKLNEKILTVFLGILFIGTVDIGFNIVDNFSGLFIEKKEAALIQNIILTVVFVLILGVVDVLFFARPMLDLFKKFKKESEEQDTQHQLTRLMKVYIAAHFILVPLEIAVYIAASNIDSLNMSLVFLAAIIEILLPIIFSAAISRGINEIYNFQLLFKKLVFPAVLIWTTALSYAFSFVIDSWILKLFA